MSGTGTAIVSVPVIGIVVRLLPGLVVGVNGGPAAETMHSRGSPEQTFAGLSFAGRVPGTLPPARLVRAANGACGNRDRGRAGLR